MKNLLCTFLYLSVILTTSARAEVTDAAAGGFTTVNEVLIDASVEVSWRAAIGDIGLWWNSDHTISGDASRLSITAVPQGCFCEDLGGDAGVVHLNVSMVSPGVVIRLTGGLGPLGLMGVTGNMTWEFEALEDTTKVTFTYVVGGYRPGGLDSISGGVDYVIGEALARLKAYVETGDRRKRILAEPAHPRPSSTVVLVRDSDAGPEVFMVRRHEESSFGDAHAFPGGVVDPEDHEVHDYCQGLKEEQANARLGIQSGGLSYYSAAIREVFEETGVLFADYSNLDENLVSVRNALNDRSMNWAEFVNQNELSLHCGQFFYCSHWITPEKMAKRYSTRFFLAELPEGQIAEHCGGELTDSCWATASDTLAAFRRGDLKMHFPTIKTLESVARHESMAELLDWARSCVEWGITSMVPMVIKRNGKNEIVLPGDKDYPGAKS